MIAIPLATPVFIVSSFEQTTATPKLAWRKRVVRESFHTASRGSESGQWRAAGRNC
jgi:hypothetical protein